MGAFATIIWATGSFWIPLVFGLVFLLFPMPDIPMLRYYYKSKYLMSFAYLLFSAVSLYFILTNPELNYNKTIRASTPMLAVLQIIIFSYVNITLIKPEFLKLRKLIRPLIPAFILIAVYFIAYIYHPFGLLYETMYYLLFGFFAFLLIYYSFQFSRYYDEYKLQLDNYYSEVSSDHLQWVMQSQIIVVATGIVAFLTGFIPSQYMILFLAGMNVFYFYYAIRYIHYGNTFSVIEAILDVNLEKEANQHKPVNTSHKELEEAIKNWESKKKFTGQNLTVENVAASLSTNRTYLSNYINSNKKKTFNAWINELRINEAKMLLLNDPHLPILEVCELVGFSDKSNFGRHFSRLTGLSPAAWRRENLMGNEDQ